MSNTNTGADDERIRVIVDRLAGLWLLDRFTLADAIELARTPAGRDQIDPELDAHDRHEVASYLAGRRRPSYARFAPEVNECLELVAELILQFPYHPHALSNAIWSIHKTGGLADPNSDLTAGFESLAAAVSALIRRPF